MMRDSTRDQIKEPANGRKLMLATVLTLGFAGVEAAVGWWSGSLALLSDAGHMVTDSAALLQHPTLQPEIVEETSAAAPTPTVESQSEQSIAQRRARETDR